MTTAELELTLEVDEVLEVETSTLVLIETDADLELDPEGEIELTLEVGVTEILIEDEVVVEIEVPGIQGARGLQGLPGTGGGGTPVLAAENIMALHVVALDAVGEAFHASPTGDGLQVFGVAATSALTGELVEVVHDGVIETAPIWTPGPLFVGPDGALVSVPVAGLYQLQVAVAISSSRLIVRPQFPIFL